MENANDITINRILDAYLEDRRNPYAERKCKYPRSIVSHVKPIRRAWGELSLTAFASGSRAKVRELVQRWRETDGIGTTTARKRLSHLKAAIRFAVDEELVPHNCQPVIKLPPNGAPRERFLDAKTELPALLDFAYRSRTKAHTLLALELMLRTGLRPSTVLALTWDLVDFSNRVVWFRDTEAFEDRTKKRRVNKPMDDELFAILKAALAQREDEDCPFVVQWNGKGVKTVYPAMKRLFKRAGVADLQVRDLRRTSATYVHNESGGDTRAAAGHIGDTEAVARRHYIQENPHVHMPAMKAVSVVMARARGLEAANDNEPAVANDNAPRMQSPAYSSGGEP